MSGKPQTTYTFFCLPNCWLVVSMHREILLQPAILTHVLLVCLSSSKCWDSSQVPSCCSMVFMQPFKSKLIKITLSLRNLQNYLPSLIMSFYYHKLIRKIKNSRFKRAVPVITSVGISPSLHYGDC